jgi:hypothetical protein
MSEKASDISNIKGIDNQTNLLKWLDSTDLYDSALDINQLVIDTDISNNGLQWSAADNVYEVSLKPIADSNMYDGSIQIKFNLGRINFAQATVLDMGAQYSDGKVPEQPSEIELFN